MNQFSYGWDKLSKAVRALAGSADQKQRLVDAVAGDLILITPDCDLPAEIRTEFVKFMEDLAVDDAEGSEDAIRATVDGLDEWGVNCAVEKVLGFYDTVSKLQIDLSGGGQNPPVS